jgi:ABC-type antimicrobial peptide transport system permease subunit
MAAGLGVGLAGAFLLRRTLQTQLYGVGPLDPLVLASVGSMLAVVAFTACAVPARRAARIDPTVALTE